MSMLKIRKEWAVITAILLMALVTNGCGGSESKDTESLTTTTSQPVAAFTVSADEGQSPLDVAFDASGSTDSNGTIVAYAWSFGDGDTGSGAQTTHQYSATGTFAAILTVTDDSGQTDDAYHLIQVRPTYSLSGTVTSVALVVADSDVNTSDSTPVANDSFDDAQTLTAPCSVSGYVNMAQTGADGRSYENGDTDDYFLASLTGGMTLTLSMAASTDLADLSLYLYDENRQLIDASLTADSAEDALDVPSDGTYYIRVEATEGASTYVLTLETSESVSSSQSPLRLSADFVPNEALVRFDASAPAATVKALAADTAGGISSKGFVTLSGAGRRDRRLKRSAAMDQTAFFRQLGIAAAVDHSLSPGQSDDTTRAKMETLWMIRGLRQQAGVLYAEPNYYRRKFSETPNDTYYDYQWHYPLIRLPEAWEITTGSNDVVVAVIDTGVLLDHPDLDGQLVDGYDFISDTTISRDGDGVDDDPDDPGDDDTGNSSFHGTHVAGTIAAATDNREGVAGIGWDVRVMPLRVLGKDGGGTSADLLEAVRYAAGLETDAGVQLDDPVDIMNLSLGGEGYSRIEAAVFEEARDAGVIIVAAAGNGGDTTTLYPAGYDGVISVSAVTIDETLADYSSYGSTISVAAPGGSTTDENGDQYPDGILSTIGDDSTGTIRMAYAFCIGTSMAVPHVAGVIALMKSVYKGLTPNQFDALLAGGYLTRDIGDSGWDKKYGYGLIDAYRSVTTAQSLANSGEIPALLAVTPGTLNFGSTETISQVVVENAGDGSLTIEAYSSDADWLTVTPSDDVDADTGLGTYTVTVSRDGLLTAGTYTGTITFESDDDQTTTVAVKMKVASASVATDGGYHYILLLDAETMDTVARVGTAGQDGVYTFTFAGLTYGNTYYIYAGTDPDNDGDICDTGESCGAYLLLDNPTALTISRDRTGLQFSTDLVVDSGDAIMPLTR